MGSWHRLDPFRCGIGKQTTPHRREGGPAPPQNCHVLKPLLLTNGEDPKDFFLKDDLAHRVIAIERLGRRREKRRGRLVGCGLKILKTENPEILLNLFAFLEIGDLIRLPDPVGLLPQKGFQVPANLINFLHPHISPATPQSESEPSRDVASASSAGPSSLTVIGDPSRSPQRHSKPRSGIHAPLPPQFEPEPATNAFDHGHAFSPPVCCYRGEKKGVVFKGCAGGEGSFLALPGYGESPPLSISRGAVRRPLHADVKRNPPIGCHQHRPRPSRSCSDKRNAK